MEKSNSLKLRTIQMKYPARYSHSLLKTEPLQNVTRNIKKSTSLQENKQRTFQPQCCWSIPKPLTQGCNPYAPHLKYGVFPRKSRRNSTFQIAQKIHETENIHSNRNHLLKDTRPFNKKGQHSEAHLFETRPIDENFTRQLSSSGVKHIDIRPLETVDNYEIKNVTRMPFNRFLRNRAY